MNLNANCAGSLYGGGAKVLCIAINYYTNYYYSILWASNFFPPKLIAINYNLQP